MANMFFMLYHDTFVLDTKYHIIQYTSTGLNKSKLPTNTTDTAYKIMTTHQANAELSINNII